MHDASGRLIGAVNMLVRKQAEANQKVLLDELDREEQHADAACARCWKFSVNRDPPHL